MQDGQTRPSQETKHPLLRLPLVSQGPREARVEWWPLAVVAAVAAALAVLQPSNRLCFGVTALGLALMVTTALLVRRASRAAPPAWLVVDDDQIARVRQVPRGEPRGGTPFARWAEPFGVSILANASRTHALIAFTTKAATRLLRLEVATPKDADIARELLEHAVTVPDADLEPARATAPDMVLEASGARSLFRELQRRGPEALRRLYLSDVRGGLVAVDQDTLVVGDDTIDLTAPVEWRFFTFHEGDAGAPALYQATAIRQGSFEAVLVCPAPEEVVSWSEGRASDVAPARDVRVAIDRLFMRPLRALLEQAPRLSRPGAPPSRDRGRSVSSPDR